jgi:hypothetical protein
MKWLKKSFPKIYNLENRVQKGSTVNLNEACFLIGNRTGVVSDVWLDFKDWAIENKLTKTKFTWPIWYGLYKGCYLELSDARLKAKLDKLYEAYDKKIMDKVNIIVENIIINEKGY